MVESTWLCERTWVQVLCIPIIRYLIIIIIILVCLIMLGDNIILGLYELCKTQEIHTIHN